MPKLIIIILPIKIVIIITVVIPSNAIPINLSTSAQTPKTTVMNKVHQIADGIPYKAPKEKKECTYLFIEADEDYVAEQNGRWSKKEYNNGFISRFAYVYEYKRETQGCKGRKELVNKFHFGGLY